MDNKVANHALPKRLSLEAGDAQEPENIEQLLARIGFLYFMEGLTQQEIARYLGINRIRVNRLLALARETGIVRVSIESRFASCVTFETELRRKFALDDVMVVQAPAETASLRKVIAQSAALMLADKLKPDCVVGVGWGRTLRASLDYLPRRNITGLEFVSLIGGLVSGAVMNSHETAIRLADAYQAKCFYIAAPALSDSEETRNLLMRQPMLEDAFAHGSAADIAYVSTGGVDDTATLATLGLVTHEDMASLREAGAVGDILGFWIDEHGDVIDHQINRRVLALAPENLAKIPYVLLASGGLQKAKVMHAALAKGWINALVTDEATAKLILEL